MTMSDAAWISMGFPAACTSPRQFHKYIQLLRSVIAHRCALIRSVPKDSLKLRSLKSFLPYKLTLQTDKFTQLHTSAGSHMTDAVQTQVLPYLHDWYACKQSSLTSIFVWKSEAYLTYLACNKKKEWWVQFGTANCTLAASSLPFQALFKPLYSYLRSLKALTVPT